MSDILGKKGGLVLRRDSPMGHACGKRGAKTIDKRKPCDKRSWNGGNEALLRHLGIEDGYEGNGHCELGLRMEGSQKHLGGKQPSIGFEVILEGMAGFFLSSPLPFCPRRIIMFL